MIVFIDDILNGNIQTLLGDLYSETIAHIVTWWAVLPMVGLIGAFIALIVAMYGGRKS